MCVCVKYMYYLYNILYNILYSMPIPVISQLNCGYAQAAVRELSLLEKLKNRKEIAFEECRQGFVPLFASVSTYGIPDEYQRSGNRN